MTRVRYRIRHDTRYEYAAPVTIGQHLLHLIPRPCEWQQLETFALRVAPEPSGRRDGLDAFDNPVTRITIEAPHAFLHVASDFAVDIDSRPWAATGVEAFAESWDELRDGLDFGADGPLDPTRFRHQSPYVRVKSELAAYARPSFPPGRPLFDAIDDLMQRIHADFEFDPEATEVGTSVLELLARRRGVCQDFAHFMIGALRAMGLPARYVSGYLLTAPPPGEPRLVGADASHAWIAAYFRAPDGKEAWIEFDPTNACLADERHVLVAWGRDFGDVSPLRGVIHGGGEHQLNVAVTVEPVAPAGT